MNHHANRRLTKVSTAIGKARENARIIEYLLSGVNIKSGETVPKLLTISKIERTRHK